MVRVMNVIDTVVAVVSVLLVNSHNDNAYAVMVAASASGGGDGGGGGGEVVTTTSDTRMVVDGVPVPVPPRKLSKSIKASKPDAEDTNTRLFRLFVFEKAVNMYRSMQQQPAPPDAVRVDDDGRALKTTKEYAELYKKYSCEGCLAFLNAGSEQQEIVCEAVTDLVWTTFEDNYHIQPFLEMWFGDDVCLEMMEECSSNTNTPMTRCQTFGACA